MAAAPSLFHIAAEATTGLNSGRGGAGVGGARALGQAGEAAADIVKNTTRIPSATGTAAYRIPDGLTSTTLTEVKNVGRLSLTNQIRDFAAGAKESGVSFDLIVRKTTEITKRLREFIATEGIIIKFLPW
jgi:hypothetical protein